MKAAAFVEKTVDLGQLLEAIAAILDASSGPEAEGGRREAV